MDIEGEVSLSYFNFHMPVPCSPLLTGNLYQAHSAYLGGQSWARQFFFFYSSLQMPNEHLLCA